MLSNVQYFYLIINLVILFLLSILLKIINIIKNIVIFRLDYIYNSKNTLELI